MHFEFLEAYLGTWGGKDDWTSLPVPAVLLQLGTNKEV